MTDLTLAERERLVKLNEELGENTECAAALIHAMGKATKAVCKTLLHGYETSFEGIEYQNRDDLMRELGDVMGIVDLMVERGDLNAVKIDDYRAAKRAKLLRYSNHQNGT